LVPRKNRPQLELNVPGLPLAPDADHEVVAPVELSTLFTLHARERRIRARGYMALESSIFRKQVAEHTLDQPLAVAVSHS